MKKLNFTSREMGNKILPEAIFHVNPFVLINFKKLDNIQYMGIQYIVKYMGRHIQNMAGG